MAASTDVSEGAVLSFDLGTVTGFVRRVSGRVQAVSGICTHQACRLALSPARDTLACPCHGATFALTGESLTHPKSVRPLPRLPRMAVRETTGHIQVYAPAR
ncbi:Rieske (2Fe-2S) protein [Streptomyces sp. NPDC002092]